MTRIVPATTLIGPSRLMTMRPRRNLSSNPTAYWRDVQAATTNGGTRSEPPSMMQSQAQTVRICHPLPIELPGEWAGTACPAGLQSYSLLGSSLHIRAPSGARIAISRSNSMVISIWTGAPSLVPSRLIAAGNPVCGSK